MKQLSRIIGSFILCMMSLILTGCPCKDCEPSVVGSPQFKVTNLSAEGENKPSAQGGSILIVTSTVNYTLIINGQSTLVTMTVKSNELPVMAGNELEIEFLPSDSKDNKAIFTLPDGKTQDVTASSPSFKWTVPDNFESGMEIKCKRQKKDKNSSSIYLISIEDTQNQLS